MEDKKILSFENLYPDELLKLELDEVKLKKIFPVFYKKLQQKKKDPNFIKEKQDGFSDELSFIKELIEDNHDKILQDDLEKMDKIYKEKNSVIIKVKGNNDQKITNTAIINFHGTKYDGHSIFIVDDYYLLIHISIASDQSGSLGIWDTKINDWCFTHSEEGFVPRSFNYNKKDDCFTIVSSAYYYGQDLIETKYLINKNRELIEIENYK